MTPGDFRRPTAFWENRPPDDDESGLHDCENGSDIDVPEDDRPPAFLVFQGGGAKGIVHVGALSAVEDEKLSIQGVAGTSAGAMVAALAAAGYQGYELFHAESKTHILSALGPRLGFNKAVDFFGWGPWQVIRLCRLVAPHFLPITIWGLILAFAGLSWLDAYYPILAKTVGVLLCIGAVALVSRLLKGITTVKRVRDFIDHALEHKLGLKIRDSKGITFEQLAKAGGLPLSIVATNVSDKCGEVFSRERTPHVPVADAVAASICLPGIFQPWSFLCTRGSGFDKDARERRFLDGGFISNLPVWTLDSERELVEDAVTIAFGIVPAKPSAETPHEGHWLGAISSSVIAGTMELDMRGVEDAIHVPIACELDLLDFDAGVSRLGQAVTQSRAAVRERLKEDLTTYPEILDLACEHLRAELMDKINSASNVWVIPGPFQVKVALALRPRGYYGSLATAYGRGFRVPPDPDGDITDAWETGKYSYAQGTGGDDDEWAGQFWRLTIPCYDLDSSGALARIDNRPLRPLVIVVEFDLALHVPIAPDASDAFMRILHSTVLNYVQQSGLHKAVQRSTSLPWH